MKAKLLVSSADARGEEFEIGREATLGRSRSNAIRLEGKGVSSRHARIYYDDDRQRYFLEDLDSLNGTALDGLAVTRPEPLDRLHVIDIAGVREFIFQELSRDPEEDGVGAPAVEPAADEASAESSAAPTGKTSVDEEISALPDKLAADSAAGEAAEPALAGTAVDQEMAALPASLATAGEPTASLPKTAVDEEMPSLPANLADESEPEVAATSPAETAAKPAAPEEAEASVRIAFGLRLAGDEDAEPVPLPEGERVVGRSRSADITVENRSVSRRHAVLEVTGRKVVLRDLDSRNHTYLEGEKVTAEVELQAGARLRFGDLEAVLIGEEIEG